MNTYDKLDQAIHDALNGLKDFQQETVRYLYKQLFENGRSKMLVADEVGLGKTIVAKGLIAKAFQKHIMAGLKREFHVIYICSNQALAAQNLRKLNLFEDEIKSIGRLIYLAYKPDKIKHNFRLSSLTPGTSFYLTGGSGQAEERLILFTLLTRYKCFATHKIGLRYLLIGGVTKLDEWNRKTEEYYRNRDDKFRNDIFKKFRDRLKTKVLHEKDYNSIFAEITLDQSQVSLWKIVEKYSKIINESNYRRYRSRNALTGLLRQTLTEVCLEYLNANLFILDEFQRYRDLIRNAEESPAIELARSIFRIQGAKILMLSATPFKPYTGSMDFSSGEDHYAEFELVLKFLMEEKDETFWKQYMDDRKVFFQFLRHPSQAMNQLEEAVRTKKRLEDTYLEAIVRT